MHLLVACVLVVKHFRQEPADYHEVQAAVESHHDLVYPALPCCHGLSFHGASDPFRYVQRVAIRPDGAFDVPEDDCCVSDVPVFNGLDEPVVVRLRVDGAIAAQVDDRVPWCAEELKLVHESQVVCRAFFCRSRLDCLCPSRPWAAPGETGTWRRAWFCTFPTRPGFVVGPTTLLCFDIYWRRTCYAYV